MTKHRGIKCTISPAVADELAQKGIDVEAEVKAGIDKFLDDAPSEIPDTDTKDSDEQ